MDYGVATAVERDVVVANASPARWRSGPANLHSAISGNSRYNDRPAYDMEFFKEGIGFSKECKLPLDEVTHLLLPIFLGIVRHNLILLRNVRRRTLQPEDGL